jgi:excinuclease ABC subunit C
MANKNHDIAIELQALPDLPGVYQYFDKNDKIIYIGKAKNLKKRVASYFTKNDHNGKTRILISKIARIEHIVVDSELDALLLENNLIKKYQPRYNILLKDDKSYPWIVVKNEAFPRIFSTRRVVKDGSTYYGPFSSGRVMHALLDLLRRLYPLRSCQLDLSEEKVKRGTYKVCLEYHIGNCKGPCVGHQESEEYNNYILDIHDILKGNLSQVILRVRKMMEDAANLYRFEEAQELKENLDLLENYRSKSTIVNPNLGLLDVFIVLDDDDLFYINYLLVKDGALVNVYTNSVVKKLDETPSDVLGFVLPELRDRFNSQAKEVLVNVRPPIAFEGMTFHQPLRGDKKALLDLSMRIIKNYRVDQLKQQKIKDPEAHTNRVLNAIQNDFRLKTLPRHIECFDNSNFQGTNAVSACVVFRNAKPSKKEYRHFNIQTVEGPDDFASMYEALTRRYKRLIEEDLPLPDLVVVDGGKGQLSSGLQALQDLGLSGKIPVVGIAKRLEEIFFPGDSIPLYLDKRSESLKVIQQMRNEAHRFGITHHRNKRSKGALQSELSNIPGVGPKTFDTLMKQFKSLKRLKLASLESIQELVGLEKGKLVFEGLKVNKSVLDN